MLNTVDQKLNSMCCLGCHNSNNCGTINIYGKNFDKLLRRDDTLRHLIKMFNDAITISETYFNSNKFVVDADLSGVTFNNIDTDFLKQLTLILQATYPERLDKCFIRNPPAIFTSVWDLIKGLIDKRTRDKVEIIKNNKVIQLQEKILF